MKPDVIFICLLEIKEPHALRGYLAPPMMPENKNGFHQTVFVAVFLGCTSTGGVGLCFLWFYDQELPKAQPAVVLVLK